MAANAAKPPSAARLQQRMAVFAVLLLLAFAGAPHVRLMGSGSTPATMRHWQTPAAMPASRAAAYEERAVLGLKAKLQQSLQEYEKGGSKGRISSVPQHAEQQQQQQQQQQQLQQLQPSISPPRKGMCFEVNSTSWQPEKGASTSKRRAVVTFVFTAGHFEGVLALYNSYLHVGPPPNTDFVLMCTDGVAKEDRRRLRKLGMKVKVVPTVETPPGAWSHPACKGKPTCSLFTKLRVWQQVQYSKILFLDSDTIILRSLEQVFSWCTPAMSSDLPPEDFPPTGMPQTGAILLTPSKATFNWLLEEMAKDRGQLPQLLQDLPTQTALGLAFSDQWYIAGVVNSLCTEDKKDGSVCNWRLNRQPAAVRDFRPPLQTIKRGLEYKSKEESIRLLKETGTFILHYVATKPWDNDTAENEVYQGVHQLWWDMRQLQS